MSGPDAAEDPVQDVAPDEADPVYAQLGRITLADRSLEEVLGLIAALTTELVPGAEDVSITLIENGRARTVVFAGQLASVLDERQYALGHGPCLDAATMAQVVLVPDTGDDPRYPDFSAQAARHGVGAIIAVGLSTVHGTTGALNVYARDDSVFGPSAQAELLRFAGYAAVAVANAAVYTGAVLQVEQMKQAMSSRSVIEQAKGMIMYSRRCTEEEAFTILRTVSMDHNRKLRDVAAALVGETQARPRS